MSKWETVSGDFIPPKLGPHKWTKIKIFPWAFCDRCGLVAMKHNIRRCNNCKKDFRFCDG